MEDQSEVIAFLSKPESYGERGLVEQVETHAAIVFLIGERAYKLKRAVRYSYLDFSTVERRRAVCEEELRLNRRTAPELYLQVRPVRRAPDGALGFDKGEPVDWLVVMQRFPARNLLAALAERGELDSGLVRDLADRIAAFHDQAEICRQPGTAGPRAVIDGNLSSMDDLPAGALDADGCAALHDRSLAALRTLEPLLDRRAREGHVRHGHGDLHLANICMWQGRPTLFDCLEFDVRLAIGDVLYDLAFLLMDLWHKNCREQAALLFNRYLDLREEGDGVAALPLFLSMRAAVRAHVAAAAGEARDDRDLRRRKRAEARGYMELAAKLLDRGSVRLVAVGGLSGTGKSTLAAALAADVGAAPGARWLRSDVIRKRLCGVMPEASLPPEAYTARMNALVYENMLDRARAMLEQRRSVIVDAVFAREEERRAIAEVAAGTGAAFAGLWLDAPSEILRERVASRRGDASDADVAVLERQLEYDIGDLADWRRLSAADPPGQMRRSALDALATGS